MQQKLVLNQQFIKQCRRARPFTASWLCSSNKHWCVELNVN